MTEKFLLNVPETASLLRVEENTVRVWLSKKTVIPQRLVVKLGKRTFFNAEELMSWIKRGCKLEVEEHSLT